MTGSPIYERQWLQSIRSVRAYNSGTPIHLFLYNAPSTSILDAAKRYGVTVHLLGNYEAYLRAFVAAKAAPLSKYPTLHKFISLQHCPDNISQVLYLDCDTYCFANVTTLLSKYMSCQWYAREEPLSARSHLGYDRTYLNETLLYTIARSERLTPVAPYNTGVCILNHGIWRDLAALARDYLMYAWRLLVGLKVYGPKERTGMFDRDILPCVAEADKLTCLRYPSANRWILDEVALWLVLGKISHLSHDTLSIGDVKQGRETIADGARRACGIAHYYRQFEEPFFSRLRQAD